MSSGDEHRERGAPAVAGIEPKVDTAIYNYEVIRPIGRGAMGDVWLARDVRLGRLVALKFLSGRRGTTVRRFMAEARATARLNHENIVTLYDIDDYHGTPYMALEYVRGETLAAWCERLSQRDGATWTESDRPDAETASAVLSPGRALALIIPVVRALVHAHASGLVHRDLKPSNIVLGDDGAVKVLDFGIALLRERSLTESGRWGWSDLSASAGEGAAAATDRDATTGLDRATAVGGPGDSGPLTEVGTQLGTAHYMAPEQWRGDPVDHRADLWAVGVILYELITGRHPLAEDADDPGLLDRLPGIADLDLPITPVRDIRPDVGKLGDIIDRCLVKPVEARIGSAAELLAELVGTARPGGAVRFGPSGEHANPYAGLAAFQEGDADRFYGRDRAIRRVVASLAEKPLIAVTGPSGLGKSSFVRAGVIPALKRDATWDALIVRPGPRPVASLAELLIQRRWHTLGGELGPDPDP
ncbi:MAG: serine/threonine-protein kinase, partial [Myxococcota bacterium]